MKKITKEELIKLIGYFISCGTIILIGYIIWHFFTNSMILIVSGQWPTATQLNDLNIPLLHHPISEMNADVLLVMFGAISLIMSFGIGLTIGGIWFIGLLFDGLFQNEDEAKWFAAEVAKNLKEKQNENNN